MKRFLRYALEHDRRIRAVFLRDGKMMQKTVSVLAFDGESVTLRAGAGQAPFTLPLSDLLSCDYARGDHGED